MTWLALCSVSAVGLVFRRWCMANTLEHRIELDGVEYVFGSNLLNAREDEYVRNWQTYRASRVAFVKDSNRWIEEQHAAGLEPGDRIEWHDGTTQSLRELEQEIAIVRGHLDTAREQMLDWLRSSFEAFADLH